jgi:hypothetical protein
MSTIDKARDTGTIILGVLRVLFEGDRREIRDPCFHFEIDPVNGTNHGLAL